MTYPGFNIRLRHVSKQKEEEEERNLNSYLNHQTELTEDFDLVNGPFIACSSTHHATSSSSAACI